MQGGIQENALVQETTTGRPISFIIRFLLLWFGSLIVVLVVTLLNNVNWTKPYAERTLSAAFNRDVKLGKMSWSIGLNGLAISTKSLTVKELSGEPFLTAGHSEIGFSVLGLIKNEIVITYIEADQADLRLVKVGQDSWNIDGLLVPGPEIRLLQLTSGKIGVFDESTPIVEKRIAPVQLEKVELKLNFPKKGKTRPFFLSFAMPSKNYSSTFRLDGLGVGELAEWKDNRYTFKADAKRVNPRDLERLIKLIQVEPDPTAVASAVKADDKAVIGRETAKKHEVITNTKTKVVANTTQKSPKNSKTIIKKIATKTDINTSVVGSVAPTYQIAVPKVETELLDVLQPVKGLFDLKIDADGTFDKGIKATIDTTADGLQINHPTLGQLNAGKTQTSLAANLSNSKLMWSDLVLKVRGMQMRSSGALSNWQSKIPSVNANVSGSLPDLGALQDLVKPNSEMMSHAKGLNQFTETLKPARLTGSADIEIKIEGTANATNLTTKLKTKDLAIKDMLTKANQRFPILCAIGLSNQAKIETDIRVENSDRIEIVNGRLVGPGTKLNASGWLDLKNDKGDFTVIGDKIMLSDTGVGISNNESAYKQLLGYMKLPGKTSFTLGGTAGATAHLKTDGDRYALDAKLNLHDAIFALKDDSLRLYNVDGSVGVVQNNHNGLLTLSGITGHMGEGSFQLDGRIALAQAVPVVDLTLHATRFDMKHLSTLMKLFQIQQMPVLTERQLYGRVKDVVMKVSGTSTNPNIFFSAVPDDLYYQPPGLAKPLRSKSGTILYDKDQLILREVALISNGKTIVTSCTIDKVSKECILSRVKAKTDSIELADINYYLSSTAMPPPMRKTYLDFLAKYKITGFTGKAYGDLLCLIGPKGDVVFDGLMGCYKTSANVFGYPITKVEGIFAASGDQLLLQDLSGYVRGSKFSLDGYVDKYRSKSPSWRAEVAAKLAPRELIELIPHVTEELNTAKVEVKSKGALALRAKVQGNFDYNKIQYTLIADKKDKLVVEGPFGKLHQPEDTPLTLDGLIGFNKSSVELGDTHLLAGQTLISLDGQVIFPEIETNLATGKPIKTEGAQPSPTVTLNFKIPQKSPVDTLIAMVNPAMAKEVEGTISGFLTVAGDLRNPKVLTDVTVNDINVAAFQIAGLNGRIRSTNTTAGRSKEAIPTIETPPSIQSASQKGKSSTSRGAILSEKPQDNASSGTARGTKANAILGATAASKSRANDKIETASSKNEPTANSTSEQAKLASNRTDQVTAASTEKPANDSILEVDSVKIRQLTITNLKAHVNLTNIVENGKSEPILKIDKGEGRLADGVMTFNGKINPEENHLWLNAEFSDVSAARIGDELMGSPDEISGKGKASIVLETFGEDRPKMIKNLKGHGRIDVENGIVSRFSDLETRLTQYNLLTQGIFGFNFNNLVQSVWPTRTGEFTSLNNKFSFADGLLKVEEMRFNGKDMRMWGSGTANLVNNKVQLDIAGKIPRVTGSRLGGGLGNVSRKFTLQKAMKMVTLGRLENLPTLPVLGAIATDKPRTFTFSVNSELDNPKLIARSIEKSFKWLQSRPDATAHPVPGLVTPM